LPAAPSVMTQHSPPWLVFIVTDCSVWDDSTFS
jgi:hypothetical protein